MRVYYSERSIQNSSPPRLETPSRGNFWDSPPVQIFFRAAHARYRQLRNSPRIRVTSGMLWTWPFCWYVAPRCTFGRTRRRRSLLATTLHGWNGAWSVAYVETLIMNSAQYSWWNWLWVILQRNLRFDHHSLVSSLYVITFFNLALSFTWNEMILLTHSSTMCFSVFDSSVWAIFTYIRSYTFIRGNSTHHLLNRRTISRQHEFFTVYSTSAYDNAMTSLQSDFVSVFYFGRYINFAIVQKRVYSFNPC